MSWVLLIALLIKSSVVAGVGLTLARFLTLGARERVDILRATVCLLLALPVIMALLPAVDLALLPPLVVEPQVPVSGVVDPVLGAHATTWSWPPSGETIGAIWLFGVILVAGRLMLGLRTLTRWTREGEPVSCPAWLAPIEDLPQVDRPKLVSTDRVDGPLSWGVAPGSILIDPATLGDRKAASAIMAHELAHLRRHDWLFLVLSRLALAMFWFNPLVWRLHAVLAERSEEAADAAALKFVDRAFYARTLVRMAALPAPHRVPGLATAMAADARTLKTRIACIMTDTSDRRRPLTLALTVVALAAVATPLAALGVSRQASPSMAMPAAPAVPSVPATTPVQPAPPAEPAEPRAAAHPVTVTHVSRAGKVHIHATTYREATPEEMAAADQARAQADAARDMAEDARHQADQMRRDADEGRRQAEVARRLADEGRRLADEGRRQADAGRRMADQQRVQADIARAQAEGARIAGEQARKAGELARQAGERARAEAGRQMIHARIQMAQGAEQMHRGASQMREEAARLRDPAYRARQIEDNRARGHVVTDEQLRAMSQSLPGRADELDRSADHLAEKATRQPS